MVVNESVQNIFECLRLFVFPESLSSFSVWSSSLGGTYFFVGSWVLTFGLEVGCAEVTAGVGTGVVAFSFSLEVTISTEMMSLPLQLDKWPKQSSRRNTRRRRVIVLLPLFYLLF